MVHLSVTLRLVFFSFHKKNKIATMLDTKSANIFLCLKKYFCILIKQPSSP